MKGDIKLFDDAGKTRKSRKTLDIFKDLEKRGYDKEVKVDKEVKEDEDENDEKSNGYDYLLRLQFRSITEEKIKPFEKDGRLFLNINTPEDYQKLLELPPGS